MQDERGEDFIGDSLLVGFLALLAIAVWTHSGPAAHCFVTSTTGLTGFDLVLN